MNKKIKNNIKVPCLPMETSFEPEKTAFKFSPMENIYLTFNPENRLNIYVEQMPTGRLSK